MSEKLRIILSGGGTGGHIYPAIAIADELKERHPDAEFLFVGAEDRMEMQKVPEAGYQIEGLWISGIQRKLSLKNLLFPFKLISSLVRSHKLIRNFQPDLAIGTGGFASGPLLRAAQTKNIPTLIQEQNSFGGLTNKLLAKKTDRICVAYEGMDAYFPAEKIKITGNPVRPNLRDIPSKREEARAVYSCPKDRKTLLVLGGSLGSQRINSFVESQLDAIDEAGFYLIWQTGKLYYNRYKKHADKQHIELVEFINTMDLALAAADVIISRAGAVTASELAIVAKPTIFIPSPNVAEDHQTKNAKAFEDKQAAVLLPEKDLEEQFGGVLNKLTTDQAFLTQLSENMKQMAKPDATKEIVNEVESLIETERS